MGANCCVAARDKQFEADARLEVSTYRNVRYSPTWNFRWDNRTHIEDIVDTSSGLVRRNSRTIVSGAKNGTDVEAEGISEGGNPPDALGDTAWNSKDRSAGQSIGTHPSPKEDKLNSVGSSSASDVKSSMGVSSPSSSALSLDPSSSVCRSLPSLPCDPASSKQAHRSPGYRFSGHVTDTRAPSLKSLNENSSPEGRSSFVHSGNDLSLGGSQGGSSDGWSMRTFTDLVASSQKERWSFDSEMSSNRSKFLRSNTQPSSVDIPTCTVCSKLLKERSPWSPQKIVTISELSVAAVLMCGHVYHAECLESVTPETDKFDPPCPTCTNGEKSAPKLSRKAELKAKGKISRTAVVDADVDGDHVSDCQKPGGKGLRMESSSSMKSTFSKPFLRRHFSMGLHPTHSLLENVSTGKKGFWARHRRD